jgi:3-hydroxyacyl-CoA dehydrogenase/enoyl-CoA hydratase/3-hydroxybutyryl-CoA epimerase
VLNEQIVSNTDAIDLATVMGLGFPPFRGGLAEYAKSIGPEELDRRLREAAGRWGNRFAPAGPAAPSRSEAQLHPSHA